MAGGAGINFSGPLSVHCADNGVHYTGIFPVQWTPFFLVRTMNISEQLECLSSAAADPARRCRIKCCAAGAGALVLVLVLLIGSITGAHAAPDSALHDMAQAGSIGHD